LVEEDRPISFSLPLTHQELGTRLLSKFRREGLINQTSEHMVLHHPDKLEALYC
jgi:hypothetical protein